MFEEFDAEIAILAEPKSLSSLTSKSERGRLFNEIGPATTQYRRRIYFVALAFRVCVVRLLRAAEP